MKEKKIKYVIDFIIICPILLYLVFNQILPSRLIIHFGPGAMKYTATFNAMVLFPLLCIALQQIICYKPDWLGISSKKRIYWIPVLMIVYYFFSFLLSGNE